MAAKATDPVKASEAAVEKVQSAQDKIDEQGFIGDKVDPEPNDSYTVAGVTKDL